MKKHLFHFTLFLMYLTLPLMATAQVVDIPDPNLRAAIEKALGKASGATITVEEMAKLTSFDARNANISDLTGLEHATRLYKLDLSNNNISDISALSGLIRLDELDLAYNNILDISALAGLYIDNRARIGLKDLYLSNNGISDITALVDVKWLERLHLSNNNISDISALSGVTDLEELDLSNNNISDLFPLVINTASNRDLDQIYVMGNPLSDTSINTHIPVLLSRGVKGLSRTKLFLTTIAPVAVGERFTLNLTVRNVHDLAG